VFEENVNREGTEAPPESSKIISITRKSEKNPLLQHFDDDEETLATFNAADPVVKEQVLMRKLNSAKDESDKLRRQVRALRKRPTEIWIYRCFAMITLLALTTLIGWYNRALAPPDPIRFLNELPRKCFSGDIIEAQLGIYQAEYFWVRVTGGKLVDVPLGTVLLSQNSGYQRVALLNNYLVNFRIQGEQQIKSVYVKFTMTGNGAIDAYVRSEKHNFHVRHEIHVTPHPKTPRKGDRKWISKRKNGK